MNLYICQTVRHLLISLIHASQNKAKSAKIIVNFEHQNLMPETFNESALSLLFDDLEILYLSESKIISEVNSGNLFGVNNLFSRNIYIGNKGVKFTHKILSEFLPSSDELFIFHEQVFLCKVYKGHKSVTLFDDGLANYSYRKVTHPLKMFFRLIMLKHPKKYTYGESGRIKRMLLTSGRVEELPKEVKSKAKEFNFQNVLLQNNVAKAIRSFFRLDKTPNADLVLLTQNLDGAGIYNKNEKIEVYRRLISAAKKSGFETIALKLHPSESAHDYKVLVEEFSLIIMDAKVPFELLSQVVRGDTKIISLLTSSQSIKVDNGNELQVVNILQDGWKGWPKINEVYETVARIKW